jgi:predicted Zn-dependent peptidase
VTVDRFTPPAAGVATSVRFPALARDTLSNGLSVWTIRHTAAPVVTAILIIGAGTADDPADRLGLASIAADLSGEGADGDDVIRLADRLGRLGTRLEIGAGPDVTTLGFTSLGRHFEGALAVLAGVAFRPHLAPADLARLRDLRLSRLGQLQHSATVVAERAFVRAVFPEHGYGHGSLGTTRGLCSVTIEDVRDWHARVFRPSRAVLIVGGDVVHESVMRRAHHAFGAWPAGSADGGRDVATSRGRLTPASAPRVVLVDRPAAPQSVLRIGHVGPRRASAAYHALVVLNAVLGGQFSSRVNTHLRERRGVTYGARTSLDARRDAGAFACETSVQADATASSIADVLAEFRTVREPGALTREEVARAIQSLTRGYVRGFELAGQFVRAAAELAAFGLSDDTFDRFVPEVSAQTVESVRQAAATFVRADEAVAVVVGDSQTCRPGLEALGWPIETVTPEF